MRHLSILPVQTVWVLAVLLLFAISGCERNEPPKTVQTPVVDPELKGLEMIRAQGELRVVTRNAPTTYYQGREGIAGPEFERVSAFADYLGVKARFIIKDSISEVLEAVKNGEADLAAAGLTRTQERFRAPELIFGPDYQNIRQQVVCRRGGPMPRTPRQLVGVPLAVVADSSYEEKLRALKHEYPGLEWRSIEGQGTEALLESVWEGNIACVIADSNIVDINRRYYPELVVRFELTGEQPLAWAMPAGYESLQQASKDWYTAFKHSQHKKAIHDRYYGFVSVFDFVDVRAFYRRLERRMPRYQAWFEDAADNHNLDWQLLAAQSYQESHWDPLAESPTGVRGIMMLTKNTAAELGVADRLDPQQAIKGGAEYLAKMRKRLPESIKEPDRSWIALAAYNVGLGHVRDARKLAVEQGLSPDHWRDLKKTLPLLSKRAYYKRLRYGYARGTEPVRYVERIRNYRDMMQRALLDES